MITWRNVPFTSQKAPSNGKRRKMTGFQSLGPPAKLSQVSTRTDKIFDKILTYEGGEFQEKNWIHEALQWGWSCYIIVFLYIIWQFWLFSRLSHLTDAGIEKVLEGTLEIFWWSFFFEPIGVRYFVPILLLQSGRVDDAYNLTKFLSMFD